MEHELTSDARPIPDHVVDGLVRFDHGGLLTDEDGREMIRPAWSVGDIVTVSPKPLPVLGTILKCSESVGRRGDEQASS
jgi:hypothetical protein